MLRLLKKNFPQTLPVLAGYMFLGIAYGVALKENGFGPVWALFISASVYAGSMQFAMLGAMTQPFAPVTMALMTLLVNARHIFYGLSMLDKYSATGKYKPYLIFSLTDETYSLVCGGAPEEADKGKWYTSIALLDQLYWVMGSVLGAVLGQIIPFDLTGIDFAMTALFTVIVTEQLSDACDRWKANDQTSKSACDVFFPAVLGCMTTLFCLITVGKDNFLLAAMALMLGCFFLRYRMTKGGAEA